MKDTLKLYRLAFECPYQKRKDDCPFKEVDCLLFKEKVVWIDNLSMNAKEKIIKHHENCSKNYV